MRQSGARSDGKGKRNCGALHGIANDSDPGDKIELIHGDKYHWGLSIQLSRYNNTMNPSFIAPNVSADTQLRFALTATDNKGAAEVLLLLLLLLQSST